MARRLFVALPFLAVPTLLITTNVWWAFTSPLLYEYGFSRNHVSESTGIASEELREVAQDFIVYFSSSEQFLDIDVAIFGVRRPLLNERELIHMRDVKGLVRGVAQVRTITLVLLAIYVIAGFAIARKGFAMVLARRLRAVGLATVPGLLVVGLLLAVAFPVLFRLFHLVSFSNPFWLLDPRTDYLVRLFPYRFFFEATMLVALATLVEALLIAGMAWGWLRVVRSREASPHGQGQESKQSLV